MCRWRSALNYLAGLVYGDGTIYYYAKNNQYFVYVYDVSREFLETVGREIQRALGKYKVRYYIVKPSKTKSYYRLQISSKFVYMYVKKLLRERPKRLTKNFVRGLIDAEGTLYVDRKGRIVLEVGMTERELLEKSKHGLRKEVYTRP